MSKRSELADRSADVAVSPPELLAKAFRDYRRYHVALDRQGEGPVTQERDVLISGKVVLVLPIDIGRGEIVLIRQFRLPAHLANGRGDMVEIVAGRVEADEVPLDAARRECMEETGAAPSRLVELFSYMPTPGVTDEEIMVFLAAVDATQTVEHPVSPDGELVQTLRVPIDAALAALADGTMRNGLLVVALQWLAINRHRLAALLAE